MPISQGDTLPDATLVRMGADGPEQVRMHALTEGRKVVIFGLPGAFTGTCTSAHLPSFMRTLPELTEKGVEEVICVAVNDPFVLQAWADQTGSEKAGITMLGDAESAFTQAIDLVLHAPPAGLIQRSQRYAMLVENGVVTRLNLEENPGICDVSGGETLLAQI